MEIKSKLVQCEKGHYYNGALHDVCPVCLAEKANVGPTEPAGDGAFTPNFSGTIPAGDQVSGKAGFAPNPRAFDPTIPPEGYSSNAGKSDMNATMVGEDDEDGVAGFDPIVGWLVCIEGIHKGKDFHIRGGYNYIGRESGDIVIPEDLHISRQNHAMVAYDSNDDVYYVGPSAGRNLIKVNGRTLFNAAELHNFDVITIGSTKLMFIGLCGDQFNWTRGRTNG